MRHYHPASSRNWQIKWGQHSLRTAEEPREGNIPFYQNNLIWSHPIQVLPLVIWVILDPKRFSLALGKDQRHWESVTLIDTPIIAQTKGPIDRGVDNGPPEVDDLEATFKELGRFVGWEVSVHTRDGGLVGLVDVHLDRRLTAIRTVAHLTWTAATNGWERVRGELYERVNKGTLTMVKQYNSASPRQRLDKLDAFRIILLINFFVIRKGRVFGFVFEVLESSSVECYQVLLPPQILEDNIFAFTAKVPLPLACYRVSIATLVSSDAAFGFSEIKEICCSRRGDRDSHALSGRPALQMGRPIGDNQIMEYS